MNRYVRSSFKIAYLSRVELHFQNVPYMDFNLLALVSFEFTTVTTMDSQEPACCYNSHLLGFLTKYVRTYSYLIRLVLEAPNSTEDGAN